MTRSKVIHSQLDEQLQRQASAQQVQVSSRPDSTLPASQPGSSDDVVVNGRQYLGDVSNQYGASAMGSKPAHTSKRRPLGGDIAPLQQQRLIVKQNAGTANTHAQKLTNSTNTHNNSNVNKNATNTENNLIASLDIKASSLSSLSSSSASNTENRKELAIPARLPQKRQATESSNNLVEKLHISSNSSSYKKSRIIDYEWQDLDEEDMDDPLMASEYVNDIFNYFSNLETRMLPDPQYLLNQRHLKPKMRSILVDWLVEMHLRFRLLPESLFLAINLMDRFLSIETIQIDKLQLLATGSLFIAAKYEEVFSPSVKNYAYFTDGSYTEDEILQAEKYILKILNFDLNYPNPMNFLRRISKADDYDIQLRTLGKYLLEITAIDHRFIGMKPSLCCASAMYLSRLILGKIPVWNGNLIHYSGGYRLNDMRTCIEHIFQFLVSPVEHDEFFKKYATRKFMKASILCRSWAKKYLAEGKDLLDESLSTLRINLGS